MRPSSKLVCAFLALLSACTSPTDGATPVAQGPCGTGPGHVAPLVGGTGMVVAGSLNGEPATFQVSTGLGLTSVVSGSERKFGLPPDPVRQTGFGARPGEDVRPNVRVRSLRAGGQEWADRSLAVRPYFMPDGGPPAFDAMVAANLLRETELEIDMPNRRVAFHARRNCQPGTPPWAPASSAPLELQQHGSPVVVVRVNGQPVRALIHSSNNATVVSRRLADRVGLTRADAMGARVRSHGTSPVVSRGQEFRVGELAVGDEILRDVPVIVTADGTGGAEEMVLGQDWLRHRKVWISFGGRRVFLARARA